MKPKTGSRKKEQVRTQDGTFSTKLTKKQKAFADAYINNPKRPNSDIIKEVYNVTDTMTASSMATENLKKPHIQLYIDEHVSKAKEKIVSLLESEKEEIQLRSAQDILDRTHGKATQRTEVQQASVQVTIQL